MLRGAVVSLPIGHPISRRFRNPFRCIGTVSVRSCRYRVLRQSVKHRRTASRSGPGALPAQGHKPVLAVDDARVRMARSHVHTGFTERLLGPTVRPSRGVHPQPGGGAVSRTVGWPVIAGISNLVRIQAITA